MKKTALLIGLSLHLSACITASPLSPQDQVSIEGRIEQADSSLASNIPLKLGIPGNELTTSSNGAGVYRFNLTGSQTQVLGIAATLELQTVPATAHAPKLRQSVKVLKTSLTLPAMRFWDDLSSPAADSELSGSRANFSWKAPSSSARLYRFSLLNSQGDPVWKSDTTSPNFELPLSVMAPQQTYHWQVSSVFSDYEAFSQQRSLKSLKPALTAIPIRSIRSGGQNYPSFYDGSYRSELSERLDFPRNTGLELEIELAQPAAIQGLHWAAAGFEAKVEIRTRRDGPIIATHSLKDFALLEWPAVHSDKLYLTLTDPSGGFSDIAEIRVLGSE